MKSSAGIAVTGMGSLCAAGNSPEECLSTIFSGDVRFTPSLEFDIPQAACFDYPFYLVNIPSENPGNLRRSTHLILRALDQALLQAGLGQDDLSNARVGVSIGTNMAAIYHNRDDVENRYSAEELDARFMRSNPAAAVASRVGCNGPVLNLANACTSGGDAIGLGAQWIRSGLCDIVIAGGVEEISFSLIAGFQSLLLISGEPCKPFDKDRSGLNLGEGAAILIMEDNEFRLRRGAIEKFRVLGFGASSDNYHPTAPDPKAGGLARAVDKALAQWGGNENSLSFINAHATATIANDEVEGRFLSERFPGLPVSATKGYTGHMLGAAGALEVILSAGCLHRGELPASAGFSVKDPAIGMAPVSEVCAVERNTALTISAGFGGLNCALVIGRSE